MSSEKYNITISYNPYGDEIMLGVSEQPNKYNNSHGLFNGSFYSSLEKINEKFKSMIQGENDIKVSFHGREYEYTLFKNYITPKYLNKKFSFEYIKKYEYDTNKIKKLIDGLPKDSFEDPKKLELIKEELSKNIQMHIMGLYSSGKSTFVNALLGDDILYTHSDIATNKLFRIIDNDKTEIYIETKHKNKSKGKTKHPSLNTLAKTLEEYNMAEGIDEVVLEITIPNIDSSHFTFEIIDTPGVNNADNIEHQKLAFNAIKDSENLPPVLFLINANTFKSTDQESINSEFFKIVKKKIQSNKAENVDRFFFILSRADEIPYKEFESNYEKAKTSLEQIGEGIKLYSINSKGALSIRKKLGSKTLEEEEDVDLNTYIRKVEKKIANYFPKFSTRAKNLQEDFEINENDSEEVKFQKSLEYTGVPMLEREIQEYLTNHAIVHKLQYTFEKIKEESNYLEDELKNIIEEFQEKEKNFKNYETQGKSEDEMITQLNKQKEDFEKQQKENNAKKKALKEFTEQLNPDLKQYEADIQKIKLNDAKVNDLQREWQNKVNDILNKEQKETYADKVIKHRIENLKQEMGTSMNRIRAEAETGMREEMRKTVQEVLNDFYKVIDEHIHILGEAGYNFKNGVKVKSDDQKTLTEYRNISIGSEKRKNDWMDWSTLFVTRIIRANATINLDNIKTIQKNFKDEIDSIMRSSQKELDHLKERSKENIKIIKNILENKKLELDESEKKQKESCLELEKIVDNLKDNSDNLEEIKKLQNKTKTELKNLERKKMDYESKIERFKKIIEKEETIQI